MIISAPIFEAYLKCPSKCWFLFLGKKGDTNIYSDFVRNQNNAYRTAGLERLMVKIQPSECVVKPSVPVNIKTATWMLAIDFVATKEIWNPVFMRWNVCLLTAKASQPSSFRFVSSSPISLPRAISWFWHLMPLCCLKCSG